MDRVGGQGDRHGGGAAGGGEFHRSRARSNGGVVRRRTKGQFARQHVRPVGDANQMVLERCLDHADQRLARRRGHFVFQNLQFQPGSRPNARHGVGIPGGHPEARRKHGGTRCGRAGLAHRHRVLARGNGHVVRDISVRNVLQHGRVGVIAEGIHVDVDGRVFGDRCAQRTQPTCAAACALADADAAGASAARKAADPPNSVSSAEIRKNLKYGLTVTRLSFHEMPGPRRDARGGELVHR